MKKIILTIGLLLTIHVITKAQKDLLANTGHKTSFIGNINYSNKAFPVTTNYMFSDSAAVIEDHAYYVKKSKNERTAGWILLGSGLVVSGVGLLISTSSNANFDNAQTGVIIMGVGAISGIVSIPFMIMAHVNRIKANLLLSSQKTGYGIPAGVGDITGLTLSIHLGK